MKGVARMKLYVFQHSFGDTEVIEAEVEKVTEKSYVLKRTPGLLS